MMLYVNGQDITRLVLGLVTDTGSWSELPQVFLVRPEGYLKCLETFLRSHQLDKENVSGFVLIQGPGSATSLRTSHALVNALAFAWQLSVTSLVKPVMVPDNEVLVGWSEAQPKPVALPLYSQDPKITATKRDALKRKTS